MTPRKPKPRKPTPRKASGPTLAQRMKDIENTVDAMMLDVVRVPRDVHAIERRLDALEARKQFRDASHDDPVSNGSEAIGHFTLTEPHRPWWRRFLGFMGAA